MVVLNPFTQVELEVDTTAEFQNVQIPLVLFVFVGHDCDLDEDDHEANDDEFHVGDWHLGVVMY